MLTTTSVGQEGLDFHAWCDTIIHWDLCRNPVDLEQREGRIQRFGGLAVRRAVAAAALDTMQMPDADIPSLWCAIEQEAELRLADQSGLAPWWVFPGGSIQRYVFDVPTSEQRTWLKWVQEQRLMYRMTMGMPNQEDLVRILMSDEATSASTIRGNSVNLSPWFSGKEDE